MEKVRYGIIGFGNMGSVHCKNLYEGKVENAVLAAICDIKEIKRNKAKELYPDVQILPLDYDPDVSFANVENRLQMLIMNEKSRRVACP